MFFTGVCACVCVPCYCLTRAAQLGIYVCRLLQMLNIYKSQHHSFLIEGLLYITFIGQLILCSNAVAPVSLTTVCEVGLFIIPTFR